MKKKALIIGLAFVFALALAGCGNKPADTTNEPAAPQTVAENTEAATTVTPAAPETPAAEAPKASEITEAEAKAIALADAGFSEQDVTFTKIGKDMDDGIMKYEVEFIAGDKEYSYDIQLSNGTILEKDIDSVYDD